MLTLFKKENSYQKALRHYDRAMKILSSISVKDDLYTNRRRVKKAGRQAWEAAIAAMEYLIKELWTDKLSGSKNVNIKRLTAKQLELKLKELTQDMRNQSVIWEIFQDFNNLYIYLALDMVESGITNKQIINLFMKTLKEFLDRINKVVKDKEDLF